VYGVELRAKHRAEQMDRWLKDDGQGKEMLMISRGDLSDLATSSSRVLKANN
jgi:hypothetical protein